MRSVFYFFLVSCLVHVALSVPLLGPYDETIQPFNLSPGNVDLVAYWKEKYEQEQEANKIKGHLSPPRNSESQQDNIYENLNLSNNQGTVSAKSNRGSRQHPYQNGGGYYGHMQMQQHGYPTYNHIGRSGYRPHQPVHHGGYYPHY